EAVAWPAEGTSLVVVLEAFSTIVVNLSKFSDLGCKTEDSRSEGLQFCWNLFQVPRGALSSQLGLAFSEAISALAIVFFVLAHPSRTKVIEPEPLTLEFKLILEIEEVGLMLGLKVFLMLVELLLLKFMLILL
nr:hypothetical protein [Tanacetum cinerariifolium]